MRVTCCRPLCLLLALVVLSCTAVSCRRAEKSPEAPPALRLEILAEPVVYSDDFRAAILARLTDLAGEAVYSANGLVLSEKQRADLAAYLEETVLPELEACYITESELDALCDMAEATNASDAAQGRIPYGRIYRETSALVGTARAGTLCYRGAQLFLDYRIATCEERYLEYGYPWYLEDAEHFRAQKAMLCGELGEEAFSAIVGMLSFSTSIGVGLFPDDAETLLNAAEAVALLQKQADYFRDRAVTPRQWQIAFSLFAAWIPEQDDPCLQALFETWEAEELPAHIALAMPALLDLYAALTRALTPELIAELEREDEACRTIALCRALSACETAFFALTDALAACAAPPSAEEQRVLAANGRWEEYVAFSRNVHTRTAAELFAAITACAQQRDPAALPALRDDLIGYLYGICPVPAFVLETCAH